MTIADNTYVDEIESWRAQMETNLRAPYSWLALFGLFWLQEGANSLGSAPEAAVRLPERAPQQAGQIELADGQALLTLGDQAPRPWRMLGDGEPDYAFVDDLRLALIERGGRPAVRGWDPQHPKRTGFQGRHWYPVDPVYRVTARVEPYDRPKPVLIDDMIGNQNPSQMDAVLIFDLEGQEQRLDAQRLEDGRYNIVIKDATAGQGTYPAARFVQSEVANDGEAVIDFNRAYSPPCAFTDHATCPLPTPENILEAAIEAGERYEAH